jgi:hypothetical protein
MWIVSRYFRVFQLNRPCRYFCNSAVGERLLRNLRSFVVLNPKSEIKMAGMRQDIGAETVWKNRSHTRSGLVKFFQTVYARQIDADRPFLFRFSG